MAFWRRKRSDPEYPQETRIDFVLRKMGLATEEQLLEAYTRQKEHGGLTGNILVEMGVLNVEELKEALDVQEKMRQGDQLGANLQVVRHQTEAIARRTSQQAAFFTIPDTKAG